MIMILCLTNRKTRCVNLRSTNINSFLTYYTTDFPESCVLPTECLPFKYAFWHWRTVQYTSMAFACNCSTDQ